MLTSDLFEKLLAKQVVVYTLGPHPLGGKLNSYDASFIHLGHWDGQRETHVIRHQIIAIAEMPPEI